MFIIREARKLYSITEGNCLPKIWQINITKNPASTVKTFSCVPTQNGLFRFILKGLKVPKCEIFHLFDSNDFYGIKSL
jgi:hypothetical protein